MDSNSARYENGKESMPQDEPLEVIYDKRYNSEPSKPKIYSLPSPLDSSESFDLTLPAGNGNVVSKNAEGSIKWLIMPWQPLLPSDRGVLTSVAETLSNVPDASLIVQSCQFITNVMLRDFPAEVFLQRPTVVSLLLSLLQSYRTDSHAYNRDIVPTTLQALYKLTRSLRFRIYYYSDPCIVNKMRKLFARNLGSFAYHSSEDRDSPDGGIPEANYHPYQSEETSDKSHSLPDIDESALQLEQILIPNYCTESLENVLDFLSGTSDPSFFLRNLKYIGELTWELIQLLIMSVTPSIWLCTDNLSIRIQQNLKSLLGSLSEVLDFFRQNSNDYSRASYLYFLCIVVKLLSRIVPLELAYQIIPKSMRIEICCAIMDAPIYLMYPSLHVTLQEYARQFRGSIETECVKLLDETRLITKSMKAAILLLKNPNELTHSDLLKSIYSSKLSLPYHKNMNLIRKFVHIAQNVNEYKLSKEDRELTRKLTLSFLANSDTNVQEAMYTECHSLISSVLGVEYGRHKRTWESLGFLIEESILTEIICHGATNENEKIRKMAHDMLIYLLKGKIQMGEKGWLAFLEAVIPVLPLLQCLVYSTTLGQSITKMLDPDISNSIKLPYIEVLKGNARLLFSKNPELREEAVMRLIWLLGQEKNSLQKLPRLSSLHGLPLNSLCIFDRQLNVKRTEGHYQKSSLMPVLDILNAPNFEPKLRKSALIQISIMMTDTSLRKVFLENNCLEKILDIFTNALIERDFMHYPDSAIWILTILRILVSMEPDVRLELSNRTDVYLNILRSLFLFPNNECVKTDAAQILALLLYNGYIMKLTERTLNNPLNISLPDIILTKMQIPFPCKSHWKTSIHRRPDVSVLHGSNQWALTFVRQFWAWEWNDGPKVIWKKWEDINEPALSEKLMIRETELTSLCRSWPYYCCQQQLYNIQNSTTHSGVISALDYLTIYLKLHGLLANENLESLSSLPWDRSFDRFLQSHPTSKDDCDLLVDILTFLYAYVKLMKNEKIEWLCKTIKNMTKSLSNWLNSVEATNQDIHQSVLRLARVCSSSEGNNDDADSNDSDSWINFVEIAVSNVCFGDQQQFYNLAYLDWVLSCLTCIIGKCEWEGRDNLLKCLGNTFIELIESFHKEGAMSFMGLSITRQCIICLNHVLHQMLIGLKKNAWSRYWYQECRTLSWLPMLWKNRDPLVRSSALQLLAGLLGAPHKAVQLLNVLVLSPGELCQALLGIIVDREEACIVRVEAILAMSNVIRNSNSSEHCYMDSLSSPALLTYIEQCNVYYEISVMCSDLYLQASLDSDSDDYSQVESGKSECSESARTTDGMSVRQTIYNLYSSAEHDHSQLSDEEESQEGFVTTPSLIVATCTMLNNLIAFGQHEVVGRIYENALHKYLLSCLHGIPEIVDNPSNLEQYCDALEMYTSVCTVLTNCVTSSTEFAATVSFSPDSLRLLFDLLNAEQYYTFNHGLVQLRNRLWTEIFNFLSVLSLTENQHSEQVQLALEAAGPEMVMESIHNAIRNSASEFGMSAIAFLAFLLSLEMVQGEAAIRSASLNSILDTKQSLASNDQGNCDMRDAVSVANKISIKSSLSRGSKERANFNEANKCQSDEQLVVGSDICRILIQLYIAHNYAKPKKPCKQSRNKETIVSALTNLLCVSFEAKRLAIMENFPETTLVFLKEIFGKLNTIPAQTYKNQHDRDTKMHPHLFDINATYMLLMNFMYRSSEAKNTLAEAGLADVVHKLWAWTSRHNVTLLTTLKLLATFTTNCPLASQSLSLTTVLPGVGLRKTPNTIALIHAVIKLISKEIENAGQNFEDQRLHFAFHVLRNAVHNHDCRVIIAKSNLLQFFTKIHPASTKRAKPWPLVEMYCLEFLIDFTYYEEGQLCASKAVDGLDVLIILARSSSPSTRIFAVSTLRNLAFNMTNRTRLLSSTEFMDLLLTTLKSDTISEVGIASSMLWSLVNNNQRGKLIARSAGFAQSIQSALGKLTLLTSPEAKQQKDLVKMLQYVLRLLNP